MKRIVRVIVITVLLMGIGYSLVSPWIKNKGNELSVKADVIIPEEYLWNETAPDVIDQNGENLLKKDLSRMSEEEKMEYCWKPTKTCAAIISAGSAT